MGKLPTEHGLKLDDLVRFVNRVLRERGRQQPSRRVRARSTARMIRFYTTLGLLDRPYLVGRTGYYGLRHALQLLALKELQAQGCSLAEVQARLYGASDEELASVARVSPEELCKREPRLRCPPPCQEAPPRWWKLTEQIHRGEEQPASEPWQVVPLAEGVQLMIRRSRPLTPAEAERLCRAAETLLQTVRQLCPPQPCERPLSEIGPDVGRRR